MTTTAETAVEIGARIIAEVAKLVLAALQANDVDRLKELDASIGKTSQRTQVDLDLQQGREDLKDG